MNYVLIGSEAVAVVFAGSHLLHCIDFINPRDDSSPMSPEVIPFQGYLRPDRLVYISQLDVFSIDAEA